MCNNEVTALNIRACKNCKLRYTAFEQITLFINNPYISYPVDKMADRGSRVASALNFLTGEGISYHPDGCEHSTLEVLIQEYFDNGSDNRLNNSSDESNHNSKGLTITWVNYILLLCKHYR